MDQMITSNNWRVIFFQVIKRNSTHTTSLCRNICKRETTIAKMFLRNSKDNQRTGAFHAKTDLSRRRN